MTARRSRVMVLLAGLVLSDCSAGAPPPADERDYVSRIQAARAAKDAAFRSKPNEPVPPHRVAELLPLKYFPPDPEYSVPAALKLAKERIIENMLTSTGEMRKEARVGVLEFTLKGQQLALAAFIEADSPNLDLLFVPFSDPTNGPETYAAGRYLELERTPTGVYNIDFNMAFNPFCYYNTTYDCPYPPKENRLPLPIRAGERLP